MRSRTSTLFLAAALLGGAVLPARALDGKVVERTVAFVGKKPVLLSDVELTKVLLKLDDMNAAERTIDESLMSEEASRLITESPSEDSVTRAIATLREKAGKGFTDAALRRKALAQLAIAGYIALRLRPQVRVEDEAVRQAYNERVASDPLAPSFDILADAIRETLELKALDQKIEEWVASLRRREDIRRVADRP
jgi:hypothetical protein